MCRAFSTWQRINNKIRNPMIVAKELKRIKEQLEFCAELYREQIKGGRYFLHEHPATATSWQTDVIEKLLGKKGVVRVTCDHCSYGTRLRTGFPYQESQDLYVQCRGTHEGAHSEVSWQGLPMWQTRRRDPQSAVGRRRG